jgi:HK97 family phage prohead protease
VTVRSALERAVSFELRSDDDQEAGDGLTLEGLAAVFGQPTRIDSWEGVFDEVIRAGAFKKSLRERTPVMQFDHGRHPLIGSIPIGSIQDLRETDEGLFVSGRITDNWLMQPVRDAIAEQTVNGMSFRFEVMREEWTDSQGKRVRPEDVDALLWSPGERGPLLRTLTEVRLHELGPVVFPAYDTTSVTVRSLLAQLDPNDRDAFVREVAELLRTSTDLAGRPAQGAGGGDPDATRGAQTSDQLTYDALLLMRTRNA